MARRKIADSAQIKFRVPDSLRAQLEQAAAERGASLNAEITERLQRSLGAKRHWETMDNPQANAIIELLANVIYATGQNAGTFAAMSAAGGASWWSDPYAYDQVAQAVRIALEQMRPPGEIALPDRAHKEIYGNIGKIVADGIISEVVSADDPPAGRPPERIERAMRLKRGLGEIAKHIEKNSGDAS